MSTPKLVTLQKQCDAWNKANPIGRDVILTKDNGQEFGTRTRTRAFLCDSGYPVIFVDGVSGYYLLDRVRCA